MTQPSVKVLLFASYADAVGRASIEVPLPAGATVRDVVAAVIASQPQAHLPEHPAVAVNREYAAYHTLVAASDEVALIPPVAGG